jgi:putative restriction endonuclease
MRSRIKNIRERIRYDERTGSDEIGCIQLVSPTFFPPDAWISQPADWKPRTQSNEKYNLASGEGRRVWEACLSQAAHLPLPPQATESPLLADRGPRYGPARLVEPRLGQATFRIAVLDAYERACAVTKEHSLPALEASHIRAFAHNGPHEVRNGLLLRADLHRLFDTGYVTVSPDLRLEVSPRLRTDYKNGRSYYPFHGAEVQVPVQAALQPAMSFLQWHNESVYRG